MVSQNQKIVIASINPVKVQATMSGFQRMFPHDSFTFEQLSVPSGVSHQPKSHEETLQGALNRANNARLLQPDADFWVGIEGGVEAFSDELMAFAWMVVQSPSMQGKSCTGTFFLPVQVAQLIRQGKEMGEADDIVFDMNNSKQQSGAAGILTHNVIDRKALYEHALILALIPFANPGLYAGQELV